MRFIASIYLALYRFVAKKVLEERAIEPKSVHAHLLATLTTSVLMWAYAFTALYTISSPVPGIVGFAASAIHLASPLLFRVSSNLALITMVMLAAGFTHQGTYSFYTGGFSSPVLIWYGIIPMLAGIIEGRKTTYLTSLVVGIISLCFFALELSGYEFPNLISATGALISQALLIFGWISLSTILMTAFILMTDENEKMLKEQKDKTQTLLQILLHDISNRVQSISLLNRKARMGDKNSPVDSHLTSHLASHLEIDKNLGTLHGVLHSVRRMHVLELEKKKMNLMSISLEGAVSNSLSSLSHSLQEKNITVTLGEIKGNIVADPYVLENMILFNIISNCIKFSQEGGEIKISSEASSENKKVLLSIEDRGIGMPHDILENLFNPKKSTTRLGTKAEKGTGLGMIIVKSMLDKMGASIHISSTPEGSDKGTTFQLYFTAS